METWMVIVAVVVAIELYYWFWWFPRNWKKNRETQDLVFAAKTLYGKDGQVWQQARKGRL
jgi:uncharacterized membrane protein YqiK